MLGTNMVSVSNELDQIAAAFNSDDTEKLMELTGQGSGSSEKSGPPRLSINYDVATEDGTPLTRGDWKMYVDGRFIFASEVILRPLLRMFEYSVWDNEANDGRGGFSCKSVQKPTFSVSFPTRQVAISVVACRVKKRRVSTRTILAFWNLALLYVIRSSTDASAVTSKMQRATRFA